jgi:hypothetical protein
MGGTWCEITISIMVGSSRSARRASSLSASLRRDPEQAHTKNITAKKGTALLTFIDIPELLA